MGEWRVGRIRWLALVVIPMILTICFAVSCGAFTRSEWDRISHKEFVGKTPEEVLSAASRVMELADPSCVHISTSTVRMIAQRPFSVNPVVLPASVGCYIFDLKAEPTQTGTVATLNITKTHFCRNVEGVQDAAAPGKDSRLIEYADVYRLFYRRVASLLYGQPWTTCTEASYCALSNNLSALCLTADDNSPFPEELHGGPPFVIGLQPSGFQPLQFDSFYLDAIKSKGSVSAKVKATADLFNEGKIDKEERNALQAAILNGEI